MNKPLKVAAWSGIVSLIICTFISPLVLLMPQSPIRWFISFWGIILGGILGIFFTNGFLFLGRKYKNPLLTVMSWISVGLFVLYLALGTIMGFSLLMKNVNAQQNTNVNLSIEGKDVEGIARNALYAIMLFVVITYIIGAAVLGTYSILFGIGLLKLKEKIEYAHTAAILNIIAGATYIIIIGFFVAIAAYVVEIVMFLKASEKLEK